jgi:hypothetical protein
MSKTAFRLLAYVTLSLSSVYGANDDKPEAAHGFTFRNATHGYSLTLPRGWVRIPDTAVKQMTEAIIDKQKASVTYDAGFQPAANTRWFQYPYVLVQRLPYSDFGLERQIRENEMGQITKALTGLDLGEQLKGTLKDNVKDMVSSAKAGTASLDLANHRFVWSLKMQGVGVGEVRGAMIGYFGRKAMVQVMFYALTQDWERDAHVCSQIIGSFGFDPDSDYDEAAGRSGWLSGSKILRDALIGGAMGAAGAAVLGVIRNRRRRRSQS